MPSALFNATTSHIDATLGAAIPTQDWTIAAYVFALSAGEGSSGTILRVGVDATPAQTLLLNAGPVLAAVQNFTTTSAQSISTNTITTSAWVAVVGTFRSSDATCRLYIGTPTVVMAECSYSSQVAGVGTRPAGQTSVTIGNRVANDRTFDGRISNLVLAAREWSLQEIESYRQHARPPSLQVVRCWWPLYGTVSSEPVFGTSLSPGTPTAITAAPSPPIYIPNTFRRRRNVGRAA